MPTSVGPNTFGEENLVFGYDLGDGINSYKGQPTTNNFGGSFRDFTGTSYSPDGEWISSEPTRFTKTYFANLPTPIGPGGTLIEESGVAGFHHLSRYGGSGEDGLHSLSCFIYPFASGITDFCIGMLGDGSNNIQFNLDTRAITYGGGISNRNAFIRDVPGWPGWLRVGANIEGRAGGWVGCFGYSSYTSYTGTAGGKKAYITGIQYEYKTQPTSFVGGTRSVTQGLLDFAGRSTIDLSNVSFDSSSQMEFDGTDDFIDLGSSTIWNLGQNGTIETVVRREGSVSTNHRIWCTFNNSSHLDAYLDAETGGLYLHGGAVGTNTQIPLNQYLHIIVRYSGGTITIWYNGTSQSLTGTTTGYNITNPSYTTLYLGRYVDASGYRWDGRIAGFKIYNRALTDSEIRANYNAIKGRFNI
jgi:hypothetical protein